MREERTSDRNCRKCGTVILVRPQRIVENLLPKGKANQLVAEARQKDGRVDAEAIKRRLDECDKFEYFILSYRCPVCRWIRPEYDKPYTEQEAEAIVAKTVTDSAC